MRFEKLAALGALAATGGIVVLFALFVWLGIPRPETGGIDRTSGMILWVSIGLVILALVALHLVLAKQLWDAGSRPRSER